MFLKLLNERADIQGFNVRCHTPKTGTAADTYGYCYVETRDKADRIARWLLSQKIDSEILQVESKQQFLVKIPFINTFAADHFERKLVPSELLEISMMLRDTAAAVDPILAEGCNQLLKALNSLYDYLVEYHKIRGLDMIQTSLFVLNHNCSEDPLIPKLACSFTIDWRNIKEHVENFCSNIKELHSQIDDIVKLAANSNFKINVARMKRDYFKLFCELSMSDAMTQIEAFRLDNDIYKQWLFLNKQIHSVQNDPRCAHLLKQCQNLRGRIMEAAKLSSQLFNRISFSFCRKSTAIYFRKFLTHTVTKFTQQERAEFDQGKIAAEQIVAENNRDVAQIRELCRNLKEETIKLAREIFNTTNAPKNGA